MSLMKKVHLCVLLILISLSSLAAITLDDAEFCLQKEQWDILKKHSTAIRDSAFVESSSKAWFDLYLQYAGFEDDSLSVLHCLELMAIKYQDFHSAVNWLNLASEFSDSHPDYPFGNTFQRISEVFTSEADQFLLQAYKNGATVDTLYPGIAKLEEYNNYIEDLAKVLLDMISTERNDSLAFVLTEKFYQTFPHSVWNQAVFYFELAHYSGKSDYPGFFSALEQRAHLTSAHKYLAALYLMSPTLRKKLPSGYSNPELLRKAQDYLISITKNEAGGVILYDKYNPETWNTRVKLQLEKVRYYNVLAQFDLFGDEDSLLAIITKADQTWLEGITHLEQLRFADNDTGSQAELLFWQGKFLALSKDKKFLKQAAFLFTQCLMKGAPRKKYDSEASTYLAKIHQLLGIKTNLIDWQRKLMNYKGPTFSDITLKAGFANNRESRIALGDYDNDSYCDILLSGRRLYRNNGNLTFAELTDTLGLSNLNATGGLFADFNLDGDLDFVTVSHSENGDGEKLMKNNSNRFVQVNERAGDIDDAYPTEGAAWVDCFHDGYPDLYCANYEKWNVRSGYEDRFWSNEKGYFIDKSSKTGFLSPYYTQNPGQAGRGVAPADFDNDGDQEIYVTNYRLNRNFLWDRQDSVFTDVAALYGLQGVLKNGYYGHSIGADWGDFDNDGDLDLFVANLAHPRYIEISDISMLLRNDGENIRVVEGDTIVFWQFSDITKQAGITYDELHSDPLWLDADNDGYLDLFITSVYENDRSYLYHNNGDGTFSDVTWLAGLRVYNGWGNAYADFNHDNKLDLVVGSGNGTKIFLNTTRTKNNAVILKPVLENGLTEFYAYEETPHHPNTPSYGARLKWIEPGKQIGPVRELCSAKGTTSQNEQILHFGLGTKKSAQFLPYPFNNKIIKYKASKT